MDRMHGFVIFRSILAGSRNFRCPTHDQFPFPLQPRCCFSFEHVKAIVAIAAFQKAAAGSCQYRSNRQSNERVVFNKAAAYVRITRQIFCSRQIRIPKNNIYIAACRMVKKHLTFRLIRIRQCLYRNNAKSIPQPCSSAFSDRKHVEKTCCFVAETPK